MPVKEPSIGIVGLGGMGKHHTNHIEDSGGEVVAGVDIVTDARRSFKKQFDVDVYEGHEEMYDAVEPDAVVVTTPNRYHEPAATAALDRDISVLCEKPLAHSLDGAMSIAEAAESSGGFCMVGFHNRFTPAATLFKAKQDSGTFGDISHVEANFVRRRGIPGPGSWFTNESLSGGGALIDIGVHAIDYAMYLMDFPTVSDVSASVRSEFGPRPEYVDPDGWANGWDDSSERFDVDDSVSAFVSFENGASLSLEVAWATNRTPTREVVVRGTQGGAETTVGGDELTLRGVGDDGIDHYTDTTLNGQMEKSGHAAQDEAFVEAIAAGDVPDRNTVEQGLAVQRVIQAIYDDADV